MLSCCPKDDHFWGDEDVSHNRQPSKQYCPLAILWGWDIWMDGDPTAGEHGGKAASDYVPYRPGSEFVDTAGEK